MEHDSAAFHRSNAVSSSGDTVENLDSFLASIQHRAFTMAKIAIKHEADAMDIVQEAMLQLVKSYSNRGPDEWRMLFFRILQNKINDAFRRRKVRDKLTGWLPGSFPSMEDREDSLIENTSGSTVDEPDRHIERQQNIEQLQAAIESLSRRQREAFMLRCWEGLSTAETAATMQCSEGSVKTHYSRAMSSLRVHLERTATDG